MAKKDGTHPDKLKRAQAYHKFRLGRVLATREGDMCGGREIVNSVFKGKTGRADGSASLGVIQWPVERRLPG